MLGRSELAELPSDSILVNTSRGDVIDQNALLEIMEEGRIGQVGLDVLEGEPIVPEALRSSDRVLLTAHSAFYSDASLEELRKKAASAALRLLLGQPERNIVNGVSSRDFGHTEVGGNL
jgi:phosphoglycerate dehydrogenase-like enzyme